MDIMLILLAFLIVSISQILLNSKYSKYKKILSKKGLTGEEVAKRILSKNDLTNIRIACISGNLSDNYNDSAKTVSLSEDIYRGTSIASISVAAHECGHAIQYKNNYLPIRIRNFLVPFVNFGNKIGYIILVLGFFLSIFDLEIIGIALISIAVIFQIITLPCEFNASKRGKNELIELGIIEEDEIKGVKSMLKAAAFTYIASLLSSILEIIRLFLNAKNDRRK